MDVLADALIVLDLTVLGDGGGAVDDEIEVFIGGDADGQRVGTEHAVDAPGRSNRRTGVGSGDADAALLCSLGSIVTGDTIVAGVADNDHAHTILLGLVDGHLHGLVTDDLTHSVVSVDNSGGLSLFDDLEVGDGLLDASLDSVEIDGFEAVAAVALDSALVGLKKDVGADLCIFFGDAVADESVSYERGDDVPGTKNSRHDYFNSLNNSADTEIPYLYTEIPSHTIVPFCLFFINNNL